VERVTVTEAARNFAEYLNRVTYRRESFVLLRGNRPIAELRPVPSGRRLGDLPSMMASLPRLSVEDADSFAQDVTSAKRELAQTGTSDPWQR